VTEIQLQVWDPPLHVENQAGIKEIVPHGYHNLLSCEMLEKL